MPDSPEYDLSTAGVLTTLVDQLQQGRGPSLPSIPGTDVVLRDMRSVMGGSEELVDQWTTRAIEYFKSVYRFLGHDELFPEERLDGIQGEFDKWIKQSALEGANVGSLDVKIRWLTALICAGNPSITHDNPINESKEITQIIREGTFPLSEEEDNMLGDIYRGLEVGFGKDAPEKVRTAQNAVIGSTVAQRQAPLQGLNPDFIKVLLAVEI